MARKAASNSSSFSVFILLDRSCSMVPRWAETLDAINAYVGEIAATQPNARVSVVAFDDPGSLSGPTPSTGGISYVALRDGSRAAGFKPIHQREVSPRGSTPLLDAVGRITSTMLSESPDRAMLVIVTDGCENASREWTKPRIRSRLEEMKAKDWQILFVGADFDAFSEAGGLGISESATLTMSSGHYGAAMASMASRSADYAATGQTIAFSEADRAAASGDEALPAAPLPLEDDGFVEIGALPNLTDDGRPPRSARHCDCPEGRCLQDLVVDYMLRNGADVTFASWRSFNWGEQQPDPWTAGHDEEVPPCLREDQVKGTFEV